MTTADYLEQLQQDREDLVNNLETKGITGLSGDETFTELVPEVLNIPSGGSSAEEKDVNFYDYDGTLVDSYSKSEFLALSAMPNNPTHSGLTSKGWNWSLSDAKTYVTNYNKLNIGQMYDTDDGSVRIHIKLEDGRLSPYLGFAINGTATVNWGDNTATDTVTGNSTTTPKFTLHNYSQAGEYVITISSENSIRIRGSSNGTHLLTANGSTTNDGRSTAYRNSIIRVEGVTHINNYSFYNCCSLQSIILSSIVTNIPDNIFYNCYSLQSITLPSDVTSIGTSAFYNCFTLSKIAISNSVTTIGVSAFNYCYSLQHITLPNSVTTIGTSAFYGCYSLPSITLPNGITTIGGSAFYGCFSLSNITIPNSVTSIGTSAFYGCYSLPSITLPNSITSIGNNTFNVCYSLPSIIIPSSVTSIGNSVFQNCTSMTNITIPNSVTTIGSSAFAACGSIAYYDFSNHTSIPTLSTNVFANIASDCKIIVPDDLYNNWITANNWSTYASYIIKKSDWDNS